MASIHNNYLIKIFTYLIVLIVLCSCQSEEKLVLDSRYENINNIITFANCNSPLGQYTTEVHSTKSGEAYFMQKSSEGGEIRAIVDSEGLPKRIATESRLQDLEPNYSAMIKAHEFHKIALMPYAMFETVEYESTINQGDDSTMSFKGTYGGGEEMILQYDKSRQLITGFSMKAPDSGDDIEVNFEEWNESEKWGKLISKLTLIQAQKDTFTFDFTQVAINQVSNPLVTFVYTPQ